MNKPTFDKIGDFILAFPELKAKLRKAISTIEDTRMTASKEELERLDTDLKDLHLKMCELKDRFESYKVYIQLEQAKMWRK